MQNQCPQKLKLTLPSTYKDGRMQERGRSGVLCSRTWGRIPNPNIMSDEAEPNNQNHRKWARDAEGRSGCGEVRACQAGRPPTKSSAFVFLLPQEWGQGKPSSFTPPPKSTPPGTPIFGLGTARLAGAWEVRFITWVFDFDMMEVKGCWQCG